MPYTKCIQCDKEFRYNPGQSDGLYCSRPCSGKHKNIMLIESGRGSKEAAHTYLRNNVEYECSECGISEWNGKHIVLQLEHKDGNPKNNTVDNICWLCPNCYTQTDTWGFKNASLDARERSRQGARLGAKITNAHATNI